MNDLSRKSSVVLLAIVLVFLASNVLADSWPGRQEKVFGLGIKTSFPYAGFSDRTSTGWGLAGLVDYPLVPLIDLTADLGYNHFAGDADQAGVDVWNICFGGRLALGAFFMGGETGYFSEVEEWSFVPSMGLRFNRFEGAIRFKAVGGAGWTSLRFGYYF